MKGLGGEFATLIGVLLLIWGIETPVLLGCIIDLRGEQSGVLVVAGMMPMLFGSLLCWAGWKLRRSEKK